MIANHIERSPRFSIVIPLYNKGLYVQKTLATVLAQTFKDFEVLVIDDGSTDAGPARVEGIDDPRIHLVRVSNGGVSRARNIGIALAKGEWVVFLDADDWLHARYLEIYDQLARLHSNVDVLGARYQNLLFDPLLDPDSLHSLPLVEYAAEVIDDLPRRWLQAPTFCTSSIAVRRSRLMALQPSFPEGESSGEDLDLWFRLSRYSAIVLYPAKLVWRFMVPDSLTSQANREFKEPAFLGRLLNEAEDQATPRKRARSLRRFVRISRLLSAREAITQQRRGIALQLLRRTFAWHEPRWWLNALLLAMPKSVVLRWHHARTHSQEPISAVSSRA